MTYVAGRVAIRPARGLPEPTVTPAEALAAAMAHEKGREMLLWSEAELVVLYDDVPRGDAVAYPAWRLAGDGEASAESYTFYIHAVTGAVVRFHSNVLHADEIQGTVTGNATPAEPNYPNTLGPDPMALHTSCPNNPDEFAIPDTWLTAENPQTGALVASGWTDENGDYALDITLSAQVDAFAELKGPGWFVLDGSQDEWGDPIAPLAHSGNPVTAPTTGVDLLFNPTPTAKWTAFVNAHRIMSQTWHYLDLASANIPVAPVVVLQPGTVTCLGSFQVPEEPGNPWPQGCLRFEPGSSTCANPAYSTIITHEYGHFIAYHLLGIEVNFDSSSFHEGFADVLAFLVFDTEIFGQDSKGCGQHSREPLVTDPDFAVCPSLWWCSPHQIGELLGALWLDIRNEVGQTVTEDLFFDWMMLAQVPGDDQGECGLSPPYYVPQSADESTLLEVLSVAAEDQKAAICDIFFFRDITHEDCPDSAGGGYYADCDGDRDFTFFDFLCFQNSFAAGAPYADCDESGTRDFLDFLCFQNEFVARR